MITTRPTVGTNSFPTSRRACIYALPAFGNHKNACITPEKEASSLQPIHDTLMSLLSPLSEEVITNVGTVMLGCPDPVLFCQLAHTSYILYILQHLLPHALGKD